MRRIEELFLAQAAVVMDYITTQQEDSAYRAAWAGDYDGTDCPNCQRTRMMKCSNGKRRCEKCNYDPDAKTYSAYDESR